MKWIIEKISFEHFEVVKKSSSFLKKIKYFNEHLEKNSVIKFKSLVL